MNGVGRRKNHPYSKEKPAQEVPAFSIRDHQNIDFPADSCYNHNINTIAAPLIWLILTNNFYEC